MKTDSLEISKDDSFVVEAVGSAGIWGVFEDDGETGYLYLYEPDGRGILNHLRVYVRTTALQVVKNDVQVEWSKDLNKCGVRIWGKMRGIIDVNSEQVGRVLLESRSTPGISDGSWLDGFAT